MDRLLCLCWRLAPLLLLMPPGSHPMSVHIINQEPVHVIPGTSLNLKARIERGSLDAVAMVTWAREPETGDGLVRVTLATCSGRDLRCTGAGPRVHVNVEQRESTLQINGFNTGDSGVYAVTVTDHTGANITAHCIVREYEAVHHVSVSINVSHSVLVCGEAWGTDPHFHWLHERSAVAQTVGRVSTDGTMLFVTMKPICGQFTCTVSNRRGYSSASYTAAPCETQGHGMTAGVVCLVLFLLLGAGVSAFLLWRKRRHGNRGERLQEHLDDTF